MSADPSPLPVVPQVPGLRWRSPTIEDLDPLYALIERQQNADGKTERQTRSDLERSMLLSWVDLAADAVVGIDDDGVIRAYGRNGFRPGYTDELSVSLMGGVDPDWRGQGIGRVLLAWQRARAVQNVADLRAADAHAETLPARIGTFTEEQEVGKARLLTAAGFVPKRWFDVMRRPLTPDDASLPDPVLPAGLSVVHYGPEVAERTRVAHNEVFLDHWGSNPSSVEAWKAGLEDDDAFRPASSFLILDTTTPAEPVVGYALNEEYVEEWPVLGHTEGYLGTLGVRRTWRGRGLARALLELSAREFARLGHPFMALDVDADNPSGAGRLYTNFGFATVQRGTYYGIDPDTQPAG